MGEFIFTVERVSPSMKLISRQFMGKLSESSDWRTQQFALAPSRHFPVTSPHRRCTSGQKPSSSRSKSVMVGDTGTFCMLRRHLIAVHYIFLMLVMKKNSSL